MIRLPRWPHAACRLQMRPRWWAEETALAAQGTLCTVPCRQVPHGDAARLWARLRRHGHDSGRSATRWCCASAVPLWATKLHLPRLRSVGSAQCSAALPRTKAPLGTARLNAAKPMFRRIGGTAELCCFVAAWRVLFFPSRYEVLPTHKGPTRPDRIAVVSSGADGAAVAQQMRLRWRLHEWNSVEYSSLIRAGDGAEGDPDLRALELRGGGRRLGRLGF